MDRQIDRYIDIGIENSDSFHLQCFICNGSKYTLLTQIDKNKMIDVDRQKNYIQGGPKKSL